MPMLFPNGEIAQREILVHVALADAAVVEAPCRRIAANKTSECEVTGDPNMQRG